jgi:hypothetical protein
VVALKPAFDNERVSVGAEGMLDHLFELAGLVAAEREAGVEIVSGE